jgi:hypothetical protein
VLRIILLDSVEFGKSKIKSLLSNPLKRLFYVKILRGTFVFKRIGNYKGAVSNLFSDVVVYQLDNAGNITKLPDYEGIPSDDNFLNKSLAEGNELFGSLLEIEQDYEG